MRCSASCGNGVLGPVFRKFLKIACLDGADFVPKSLDIAKADFGYSRTYLTNVMSIDAALDGKQYDLVNSSEVIPYISPEKYLHFFKVRNSLSRQSYVTYLTVTVDNLPFWRFLEGATELHQYPADGRIGW